LLESGARFLVVGGYAVIHYTQPRYTKALDIWIEPSMENARAVACGLEAFGIPDLGITLADLAQSGTQFMLGLPPNAIDFITICSDSNFEECWERRELVDLGDGLVVPFLGREDLLAGKESLARDQDRMDAKALRQKQ
jgi:hypothetical protein